MMWYVLVSNPSVEKELLDFTLSLVLYNLLKSLCLVQN